MPFASLPVVDSHVHFLHPERADELLALLAETSCVAFNLVCLPKRTGEAENETALALKARDPARIYVSGALDHGVDLDLASQVGGFRARGIDGLKMIEGKPEVRKLLPLPLDGPAYERMWAEVARLEMPVVLHLGDPPEFWDPGRCPDWARDAGWDYGDGSYPRPEALLAEVENVMARHPQLKLILAHFGFLSHDLDRAARLLDAHPGMHFDLAPHLGMYDDFARDPRAARTFFLAYAARILYGTDLDTRALERGPSGAGLMRFIPWLIRSTLERSAEFTAADGRVYHGLGLPEAALRMICAENFRALYGPTPLAPEAA